VRDVAIGIHAVAAVVALFVGSLLVSRVRSGRAAAGIWVYWLSLAVMTLALLVAVALDWPSTDVAARTAFVALIVLAFAMVWQAERARRIASDVSIEQRRRFIDRVGFTLIALVVGFAVVTALDVGAPGWVVAVVGVATVLAGRRAVEAAGRSSRIPRVSR
jgi:hypothetical protein